MAGYATSLVHSIYPAEFAAISRNTGQMQNQAALAFAERSVRDKTEARRLSVTGEFIKPEADRDADGHWTPHRRKRKQNQMDLLAGEGSIIDSVV